MEIDSPIQDGDKHKDCVDAIVCMMSYNEKLAAGLIVQVWYPILNSNHGLGKIEYESSLRECLKSIRATIVSTEDRLTVRVVDLEFGDLESANLFRQSPPEGCKCYSNRINIGGSIFKKPTLGEVQKRKDALIRENCDHLKGGKRKSI